MANQRKRGLRLISTWAPGRQINVFRQIAKARGLNISELLREVIISKIHCTSPGPGIAAQPGRKRRDVNSGGGQATITIHATIEIR